MIVENWKDIPGYEGRYQVSDLGRVRSVDHRVTIRGGGTRRVTGKVKRAFPIPSGHLTIIVGGKPFSVHVLVLRAFVGPAPKGTEALHGNHNPADNRLSNLRWGTRGENLKMDYAAGARSTLGERNGRAKITAEVVRHIRFLRAQGFLLRDIADGLGVQLSAVSDVTLGRSWAHVI